MEKSPKDRARRDATLKNLPHEKREQVREWFMEDGWESCAQRCLAELAIASPKDPAKPVSRQTIYDALNFWDAQEITDEMFSFRDAQSELMAQFKPGDSKLAREFGEFSLLQRANKTQDKDIFMVATLAQDSRRRLDLAEETGKTKAAMKKEQLSQGRERLKLDWQKFTFDGAKAALAHLAELRSIAADRTLNDDQKIEQVRLRLWGAPPKEMEGK